ncbi:MAG: formate dehydrogenase beta subunit [Hyphomicrobiales bacterium]|nr:MAG: formate dehydrogenase beta subunit [Hyphomicrobiales bacterium]
MTRVFIPLDSFAVACGADEIADELALAASRGGHDVAITRNGSRGMAWLEPMLEVETDEGRIAYGPIEPGEIAELLSAGFLTGGAHAKRLGPTEKIPFLAKQTRLTFKRCGITDPLSLDDYRAHGGFDGLTRALSMTPQAIVQEVTDSGLRGRGGAGFPTGIKWKTVLETEDDRKYIVVNADEGDSGTFADRMIMEGDPFCLIEGMAIAASTTRMATGYSERV